MMSPEGISGLASDSRFARNRSSWWVLGLLLTVYVNDRPRMMKMTTSLDLVPLTFDLLILRVSHRLIMCVKCPCSRLIPILSILWLFFPGVWIWSEWSHYHYASHDLSSGTKMLCTFEIPGPNLCIRLEYGMTKLNHVIAENGIVRIVKAFMGSITWPVWRGPKR